MTIVVIFYNICSKIMLGGMILNFIWFLEITQDSALWQSWYKWVALKLNQKPTPDIR